MANALSSRTTSGFPLSIGTGMAMESLFTPISEVYDKERKVPDKVDLTKYNQFWVNASTLFRNMASSVPSSEAPLISHAEFADNLAVEMEVIKSLFRQQHSNIEVVFFYNDYKKLFSSPRYSKVQVRVDNSDMKRAYTKTMVKTMEELIKNDDSVKEFHGSIIPTNKSSALICTHQPFDLLSAYKFGIQQNSLHLLESHTGVVKKRHEWNSKYYPIPSGGTEILPFHAMLMFVFGDRSLIQPMPMELRKTILNIAQSRKWTPFTTIDKIKFDITNDIKEFFVRDFVLSLPSV